MKGSDVACFRVALANLRSPATPDESIELAVEALDERARYRRYMVESRSSSTSTTSATRRRVPSRSRKTTRSTARAIRGSRDGPPRSTWHCLLLSPPARPPMPAGLHPSSALVLSPSAAGAGVQGDGANDGAVGAGKSPFAATLVNYQTGGKPLPQSRLRAGKRSHQ